MDTLSFIGNIALQVRTVHTEQTSPSS